MIDVKSYSAVEAAPKRGLKPKSANYVKSFVLSCFPDEFDGGNDPVLRNMQILVEV